MTRTLTVRAALIWLLALASQTALAAGTCSNCSIKSMGAGPHYDNSCGTGSCVFIMMSAVPGTRPSCSVSSWNFVLDTSTDRGRKTYALLLSAYLADKPLNISGTGQCTLQSDAEDLLYAYFAY